MSIPEFVKEMTELAEKNKIELRGVIFAESMYEAHMEESMKLVSSTLNQTESMKALIKAMSYVGRTAIRFE